MLTKKVTLSVGPFFKSQENIIATLRPLLVSRSHTNFYLGEHQRRNISFLLFYPWYLPTLLILLTKLDST